MIGSGWMIPGWLGEVAVRPLRVSKDDWLAATETVRNIIVAYRWLADRLEAGEPLPDVLFNWVQPTQAESWYEVLDRSYQSGVLLLPQPRVRLRAVAEGLFDSGTTLSHHAFFCAEPDERIGVFEHWGLWRAASQRNRRPMTDKELRTALKGATEWPSAGTNRTREEKVQQFREIGDVPEEHRSAMRRQCYQDSVLELWIAQKVSEHLSRSLRYRPER